MENQEKKQKIWQELLKKYSHLSNYCTLDVRGLEDDNIYFHPTFNISDSVTLTSQCDVNNNNIYAIRFNIEEPEYFSVEIYDGLLDAIIIGYHTNKNEIMLALETLNKVRKHISNLNDYTSEYIHNIILGSSINDVTNQFINELNSTNKIISFMQQSK